MYYYYYTTTVLAVLKLFTLTNPTRQANTKRSKLNDEWTTTQPATTKILKSSYFIVGLTKKE